MTVEAPPLAPDAPPALAAPPPLLAVAEPPPPVFGPPAPGFMAIMAAKTCVAAPAALALASGEGLPGEASGDPDRLNSPIFSWLEHSTTCCGYVRYTCPMSRAAQLCRMIVAAAPSPGASGVARVFVAASVRFAATS